MMEEDSRKGQGPLRAVMLLMMKTKLCNLFPSCGGTVPFFNFGARMCTLCLVYRKISMTTF
jgi:hypothetical protein